MSQHIKLYFSLLTLFLLLMGCSGPAVEPAAESESDVLIIPAAPVVDEPAIEEVVEAEPVVVEDVQEAVEIQVEPEEQQELTVEEPEPAPVVIEIEVTEVTPIEEFEVEEIVEVPIDPGPYSVVGVELDDVLNVRAGPGTEFDIVGTLPPAAADVTMTGESELIDESTWAVVIYGDVEGWVHTAFLAKQYGTSTAAATAASGALSAIRTKDYEQLATFVHPEVGVKFSPYTYVRDEHIVFSKDEIAQLDANEDVYLWGRFDGTGFPIELTFHQYWYAFIYDREFFWPENIGLDESIGYSNDINNIAEYYPDAVIIEYHFSGFDPRFDGMDWRGLRLVMEEYNGEWVLVGVVHTEWTI